MGIPAGWGVVCRHFAVADFVQRSAASARRQIGRAKQQWGRAQQQIVEKSRRAGAAWLQRAVRSVREFVEEAVEDAAQETGKPGKPLESEKISENASEKLSEKTSEEPLGGEEKQEKPEKPENPEKPEEPSVEPEKPSEETEKQEKQEKQEKPSDEATHSEKTKLGELEEGDVVALEALDDGIRRFELNGCEVDAKELKVDDGEMDAITL